MTTETITRPEARKAPPPMRHIYAVPLAAVDNGQVPLGWPALCGHRFSAGDPLPILSEKPLADTCAVCLSLDGWGE